MAVSTQITTLQYASTSPKQVETATAVGTITTAGNATVIVTSKYLPSSPITLQVAVLLSDTATAVAGKVRTALLANPEIISVYGVNGSGATVVLTSLVSRENDATLNVAINNGTCAGLTNAPTSVNTTAGGTYTKLLDITSYPDLGSTPSKLDTTDLSQSTYKTSILGLQELPDLTFEANYDEAVYNTISALSSNYFFQLLFGSADGQFNWEGQCRIYANGGGVDEVRKMTITLSASTPIVYSVN